MKRSAMAAVLLMLLGSTAVAQQTQPCKPWPACVKTPPGQPGINPGRPGDPTTPGILPEQRRVDMLNDNAPARREQAK